MFSMGGRESLLETLREVVAASSDGIFAFDADGTLWSGDVGVDVFLEATGRGALREAARGALEREARALGIEDGGTPSEIALRLYDAHLAEKYPELRAYAMMAWAYAGLSASELVGLARQAFDHTGLAGRLHRELEPILALARDGHVRVIVVSASPLLVVGEAVALWGLEPDVVVGTRVAMAGEELLDHLAFPVPYAETKPQALREKAPSGELLASFGDSLFDVELLRAARVGVAVRPKPALRTWLAQAPDFFILDDG
jgi:phosphatidylglycerophosphatase C